MHVKFSRLAACGVVLIVAAGAQHANADPIGMTGSQNVVDLVNNQTGSAAGALFWRADYQSAGTGYIDPFVRIQRNGEEQGYNTSGRPVRYDELTDPNFTRDLQFGAVPTVDIAGTLYKQFILDINEPNGGGQSLLSLDKVNIYTSAVGGQTGLENTLGTLRWSLSPNFGDHVVLLDYDLNSGSGQGDMQMYVPLSNFAGVSDADYLYLYSYFGRYMTPDYTSGDGFEEWSVLSPNVIPLPPSALLGMAGLAGVAGMGYIRRRR